MLQYRRADRLGDLIQQEICDLLQRRIKDPRIGFCTIIRTDVSDDLRHVKVYVSIMGDEKQQRNTLAGLKSATGFIRREIGRKIELRRTPEIAFVLDKSVSHSIRIAQLIKEEQEENREQSSGNSP